MSGQDDQLYEITVPLGVLQGHSFHVMIAGALMSVQCPQGVNPGDVIQA